MGTAALVSPLGPWRPRTLSPWSLGVRRRDAPGSGRRGCGQVGREGLRMAGARVCKKTESLQELTPLSPATPPPHSSRQPSRAAGGGGSSVLSSPPRRAQGCPPGPRLRPSPPFLSSRLLGPSNFTELPAGAAEAGAGAGRGADWAAAYGRCGPRARRPGAAAAPGAPAAAGCRWARSARAGICCRLERGAGASLAGALPAAVSHFLGILPLLFISLRRKLGFKKKKKKKKE